MPDFETAAYTARYDPAADREQGPSNELEIYYSPDSTSEIRLTTNEREDFERFADQQLTSDVLTTQEFEALHAYLVEEQT